MNIDPLAEKYYENSTYNYAVNNPVFFIDPNGMEVDVTALVNSKKSEDNWLKVELMISLANISGMTITTSTDKKGKTTLKGKENKEIEGESSTASKYVSHLLTMSETITVEGTNEGTSSNPSTGRVYLDSAQINGIQKGLEKKGIDKDVMSVGMAFLHETIHTKFGANWWTKPQSQSQKSRWGFSDFGDGPGNVDNRTNVFRQEMGLPTLYDRPTDTTLYISVKGKKVEVPHQKVEVK